MRIKSIGISMLVPLVRVAECFGDPLRRAWAVARFSSRTGTSIDPSVVMLGVPELHGSGRVSMGHNLFLYRELYFETQEEGSITIGNNVVMSRGVHVISYARVEIGDGAMIGEYSSIRDANHRWRPGESVRYTGHCAAPISIGRSVWIGRGVTILPGVTIGAGAVIGANAVVTNDIPACAIAAGVPARVLRRQEVS
jgi:acetyltransferase-like isoleucine patch superfamily enzyme